MKKRKTIKPKTFDPNSVLNRAIKYLNYSDDVFFYGLHRSKILKKAKFDIGGQIIEVWQTVMFCNLIYC